MNIEKELNLIWQQPYLTELPLQILSRGYMFCQNNQHKDILITGINPSFRAEDKTSSNSFNLAYPFFEERKRDNYWKPVKKMVFDGNGIDLRERCAYLDIFYFREQNQNFLKKELLSNNWGVRFLAEQLNITQRTIEEVIKPRLIIIKNRESAGYWGRYADKGLIWMGYNFEFIRRDENLGEICKIVGLIDSSQRIAPEIKDTNLKGTMVLFTHHINQYTKREKRPTPAFIQGLLE